MVYTPSTDFLALLRTTSGGMRSEAMPGLDYLMSALGRIGLITLYVGQAAPTSNQTTTVWIQPAVPSWSAEGTVYLWNSATGAYAVATPKLWSALFALIVGGYAFQSIAGATGTVTTGVSLCAVQRNAPSATALLLPPLSPQFATGNKLQVVDFSTNVSSHDLSLSTPDGATIMGQTTLQLLSTANQLAGVQLTPSPDLNAWVIAP